MEHACDLVQSSKFKKFFFVDYDEVNTHYGCLWGEESERNTISSRGKTNEWMYSMMLQIVGIRPVVI